MTTVARQLRIHKKKKNSLQERGTNRVRVNLENSR